MKTAVQLLASILQVLEDISAGTWLTAETTEGIAMAKISLAEYLPYVVRHTMTTTASRDLELGNINNLLEVREVEYEIDKAPRQFRNFEMRGFTLSMLLDTEPAAGETVYLYIAKPHVIMATTDLVGAVDLTAGYAAGAATIHIDGMATSDVLEEDSVFTIAGLSGSYRLTAAATLATNEGDITFSPGLAAAVANDAVVTFYPSTFFDPRLENIFIGMTAAQMALNKARTYIGSVTVGAADTMQQMTTWGNLKMADARRAARAIARVRIYTEYPRG